MRRERERLTGGVARGTGLVPAAQDQLPARVRLRTTTTPTSPCHRTSKPIRTPPRSRTTRGSAASTVSDPDRIAEVRRSEAIAICPEQGKVGAKARYSPASPTEELVTVLRGGVGGSDAPSRSRHRPGPDRIETSTFSLPSSTPVTQHSLAETTRHAPGEPGFTTEGAKNGDTAVATTAFFRRMPTGATAGVTFSTVG